MNKQKIILHLSRVLAMLINTNFYPSVEPKNYTEAHPFLPNCSTFLLSPVSHPPSGNGSRFPDSPLPFFSIYEHMASG